MQRVRDVETKKGMVREYRRFGLWHKIEHWIFMASFSILGLTGLLLSPRRQGTQSAKSRRTELQEVTPGNFSVLSCDSFYSVSHRKLP